MANVLEYTLRLASGGFTGPAKAARAALTGIGSAASGIAGKVASLTARLGAMAGATSAVGAAFAGIKGAANMEQTEVAFETLIGNADLAQKTLKQLAQLGASTPFEFPELATAARSLIAFGESASDVTEVLRRVGDISSGISAPIGDIAEIYGKARVQGTLFAEDINQLTGRGVPIIQEFAAILGVTQDQVKGLASEGKITFPMLEESFKRLTSEGGKFGGMMAKQSGTTMGLWSTVQDTLGEIGRTIGKPINEHFLKPLMKDALSLAPKVLASVSGAMRLAETAMKNNKLGEFAATILNAGFAKAAAFGAQIIGMALAGTVKAVAAGMGALFGAGGGGIIDMFSGIGDIIRGSMGDAFNDVVLDFQARLTQAVQKVMSLMGMAPEPESLKKIRQDLADMQGGDAAGLVAQGKGKIDKAFGVDRLAADLKKAIAPIEEAATNASKAVDALGKAANGAVQGGGAGGASGGKGGEDGKKRTKGFSFRNAGIPAFGGLTEFEALQMRGRETSATDPRTRGKMGRAFDAFFRGTDTRFDKAPRRMSALETVEPVAKAQRQAREAEQRSNAAKQVPPKWETVEDIRAILARIVPV